jgi:hypothetical protein
MSLKHQPWWPWASAALWGLVVFALVLVNSGNLFLAGVLGLAVTALSRRIDRSRQQ